MHSSTPVAREPRPASAKKELSVWSRRLHSWTSMVCMVLILFFAVTGLTLNHPEWTGEAATTTTTGTLPAEHFDGDVDYLAISERLRSTEGVTGTAGDHGVNGTEGHIAWSGPGYEATVFFDTVTRDYTLTETTYGPLAWANDLHKGRGTSTAWSWAIDASAVFLAFVAATGLVLQLTLRRRRRTAVALLMVGAAVSVAAMVLQ